MNKSLNTRLSVHHIGGRAGSRAFPLLNKFEKDIVNVIYDADPDCLTQIQERNQRLESELHVLPYCLADACKSTSFNINYDPYTSSLRDINPKYSSYYSFNRDHDYIIAEVNRVMETRHIEAVSMDHIFQSANVPIPPPDFLSIDTRGSEYEILQGAKETLKSSVVALVTEAEFHPIYKGQRLFGDLVKLLSEQGFDFVRFLNLHEASPFRAPIGLRGEGFHMATDALFLRQIENIDNDQAELRRYLMLQKLSFMAIIFHQFEYGLECLRRSKDSVSHPLTIQEEPVYLRFLRELEQRIEKMPILYPATFTSKYASFAASKSRFVTSSTDQSRVVNRTGIIDTVKQVLRQIPILYSLLRVMYLLPRKVRTGSKSISFVARLMFTRASGVEAVLIKYGLKNQANILRRNRVIQSQFIKKS